MTFSPPLGSIQRSFEDLEHTLRDTTFVVVDLETTGGSAQRDAITEIGAVKVRGGDVLGEFATLVNPGRPIPTMIVRLTHITDDMVASAPALRGVLTQFLEFARGAVLVAHNAPFDIGFLRAACVAIDIPWPNPPVVDTVKLARSVLDRHDVPSVKLSILAPLLGATVEPNHRAIADARATVDVLHALIERIGPLGATTMTDLNAVQRRVPAERLRKRYLADGLPPLPGVYLFKGPAGEVLYVGTSTNLRRRVQSYFTAAESRARMSRMIAIAMKVDHVVCATALEANIREQRLIAAHRPPYNRRSKNPGKTYWIHASTRSAAQVSIIRTPPDRSRSSLGPFQSMKAAKASKAALDDLATPLQQTPAQILTSLSAGDCTGTVAAAIGNLEALAAAGQYASATTMRDEIATLIENAAAGDQCRAFAALAQLVAARSDNNHGWYVAVIRYGVLAAAEHIQRGTPVHKAIYELQRNATTVLPGAGPLFGASLEECVTLLRWVNQPGTRLVDISSPWAITAHGAARWGSFTAAARRARGEYDRSGE